MDKRSSCGRRQARPGTLVSGLDPAASLADNGAAGFFGALGGFAVTGPALMTINDVRIVFIDAGAKRGQQSPPAGRR